MGMLATKYRPKTFEDTLSQGATIEILKRQLAKREFTNCYLFTGASGCGKTTLARIFANEINNHLGSPIEIDGASNNGVDNVRQIIEEASQRSIDSEYKIFIIDECHMITTAAWNAFLKCLEEPPVYTIFMFCTTNPEKIPITVLNRVMRFNISRVDISLLKSRLCQISANEGYTNYEETCDYISKLSDGGVRDALAYLEKCSNYSKDLSLDKALTCLGNFSYDTLFNITVYLFSKNEVELLETVDNYYKKGYDLRIFIDKYLDFILDLDKYCLFKDIDKVKIPSTLKVRCDKFTTMPNAKVWCDKILSGILNIKNTIKYDLNYKNTIEVMLLELCRKD